MEDKFCLKIDILSDDIVPQFMCFPLAVVRAYPIYQNWLFQNYMMPVARLDGMNCLTCRISDALLYGAWGGEGGKVLRINSINKITCSQLGDIISVVKENIGREYYCVLFLDFYYLSCAETYYGKQHFIHEILFYGYDDTLKHFFCYGYFERLYRLFFLSYEEVERAFHSGLEYIEAMDGWDKYMMVTLQRYGHETPSPYCNEVFLDKLEAYIKGETTEQFRYDNFMDLKFTETSVIRAGSSVTGVFLKYVGMLEKLADAGDLGEKAHSQLEAFNLYKSYHRNIAERLAYFAEINGVAGEAAEYVSDYQRKAVERSAEIRMLYLKFLCQAEKKMPVMETLRRIKEELYVLDRDEEEIISGFLHAARHLWAQRMKAGGKAGNGETVCG